MNRGHPFVKAVAEALRHHCRVRAGSTLVIGVSGGADSVALLRAMTELAPRRGWAHRLVVGHVQHHLRPDDAEQDARFTVALAQSLKLPVVRHDLSPADAGAGNVEAWARRARYTALEAIARSAGAVAVMTAHHGDDLLETILMRLMRGSAPRGLAGIPWRRRLTCGSDIQLCRPMLALTHQQAVDYLTSLGQPWRVDHTNADTTRLRAAIRHRIIPQMKAMAPHVTRRAWIVGAQQRAMNQVLAQAVTRAMGQLPVGPSSDRPSSGVTLPREIIRSWPMAVAAEVLRRCLVRAGVPRDALNHRQMRSLTQAVRDGHGHHRVFQYAGGVTVTLDRSQAIVRTGKMG